MRTPPRPCEKPPGTPPDTPIFCGQFCARPHTGGLVLRGGTGIPPPFCRSSCSPATGGEAVVQPAPVEEVVRHHAVSKPVKQQTEQHQQQELAESKPPRRYMFRVRSLVPGRHHRTPCAIRRSRRFGRHSSAYLFVICSDILCGPSFPSRNAWSLSAVTLTAS